MNISGGFKVAVRGPVKLLGQLPELPRKWFQDQSPDKTELVKDDMESVEMNIAGRLKELEETDPETIAVLDWRDKVDAVPAYMDMLDYMTHSIPELEFAVGVGVADGSLGDAERSFPDKTEADSWIPFA